MDAGPGASAAPSMGPDHLHAHPGLRREIASVFYGPFREPPNPRLNRATAAVIRWTRPTPAKAMREIELDLEEGADMIMVKPAMPYLGPDPPGSHRFPPRSAPTRSAASSA